MNLQFFGGRGGKSGKKKETKVTLPPPSGVTYEQFRAMSDDDKYNFIRKIMNDKKMIVPDSLDKSLTSKVMYAMGMNNKPQVVSDSKLDKIEGEDLYRTVYDSPTISSMEILDQIRYGDYTQLSGSGGSDYGRALYFVEGDFLDSSKYGSGKLNPVMMRAKFSKDAKIATPMELGKIISNSVLSKRFDKLKDKLHSADRYALMALSSGFDGWRAPRLDGRDYVMVLNRGALTVSSTTKKIGDETSWYDSKKVK